MGLTRIRVDHARQIDRRNMFRFILTGVLVPTAILDLRELRAQAPPRLPDPLEKAPLRSSLSSRPDPSYAREIARQALNGLDDLTRLVQQNASDLAAANKRLKEEVDALESRERAMPKTLAELRVGAFCQACRRTRSEITATGESWQKHLDDNSQGRAVPATPQELETKANELEEQILYRRELRDQTERKITRIIHENDDAWDQVQQGINLWRSSMTLLPGLIRAKEQPSEKLAAEIRQAEDAVKQLQAQKTELLSHSPVPQGAVAEVDRRIATYREVLRPDPATQFVTAGLASELHAAEQLKLSGYGRIPVLLARTASYANYLAAGPFDFVSPSLPALNLSPEPVGVSSSAEQLGVRFNFGRTLAQSQIGAESEQSPFVNAPFKGFRINGHALIDGGLENFVGVFRSILSEFPGGEPSGRSGGMALPTADSLVIVPSQPKLPTSSVTNLPRP